MPEYTPDGATMPEGRITVDRDAIPIARCQQIGADGMTTNERRIAELEAALTPFADVIREMRKRGVVPERGNYINADVETSAYLVAERLCAKTLTK